MRSHSQIVPIDHLEIKTYTVPTDSPEVRRYAGMGPHNSGSGVGRRRRQAGHRLHLRRHRHSNSDSSDSIPNSQRDGCHVTCGSLHGHVATPPKSRPTRYLFHGNLGRRLRALGSQSPLAESAISHPAGPGEKCCADLWQRWIHFILRQATHRPTLRLGKAGDHAA